MSTWTMTPAEFAATAEKIGKINLRAAKRGFTGHFTLVGVNKVVERNGLEQVMVEATLSGVAPAYAGWKFLAAVDTVGEGFVLRVAPGVEETGVDRSTLEAGRCEHCGVSRRRKYTYLVREEATGRTLQVGSTCIKDFLGWEGNLVFFSQDEVEREVGGGFGSVEPVFTPTSVVAVAAAAVAVYGYVPAGDFERITTKETVMEYLVGSGKRADEVRAALGTPDHAKAAEMVSALLERGLRGSSDYAQNLRVVLEAEFVGTRQIGLAASAVSAYRRMVEGEVKRAAAPKVVNAHIGARGQKITVTGVLSKVMEIDSQWGLSVLLVLQTPQGVVKTFTSAAWAFEVEQGQEITMTATVKDHETYQGLAQTLVNRPKKEG